MAAELAPGAHGMSEGCRCSDGCEGGPECLDDEGGPLPAAEIARAEAAAEEANLDDWECGPCQRGQHSRCRSPECGCCAADPDLPRLPGG